MTVDLLTTLRHLEERLLMPEVRGSSGAVGALLSEDFVEFGSSGSVYDKSAVIVGLQEERLEGAPIVRQTADWRVRELGADAALITYLVQRREAPDGPWEASLRSSIWHRRGTTWQMVFHQGTRIPS